jgi:membrane protein
MDKLRGQVERILTDPGRELGRWARLAKFQVELWRFCARRLRENNVMAMSAALSFRTVFAMIPVLVLALLVLKSVGALEDSKRSLRTFLDASGFGQIAAAHEGEPAATQDAAVPSTQPAEAINLADKLEEIVTGVESKLTFDRIGPVGGVLLIWTAITLLTTLERSLNRIFEAPRSRALGRRILLYWSAMTLGPIALVAAAYVGRSAIETFHGATGLSWLLAAAGRIGPIIVGIVMLAAVYKLLPNTRVRNRSALGGAIFAVPVWLLAKWGFATYVQRLVVTGNLYGVLGVLPLFLLWLNLSWLIFLFGAQLAHTAANLARMRLADLAERIVLGPSDLLAASLAVAKPFTAGGGAVPFEEIAVKLSLPGEAVQWLVDRLAASGIVCPVGDDRAARYVLARPAEKIMVTEILETGDPRSTVSDSDSCDGDIAATVARVQHRTQSALASLTLADVLADDRQASGS